ncbi:MAG: enolase C-terminal domain-like protein [Pseudomonadales bacterium]
MRITAIHDQTIALQGAIANAVVDFSSHTVSLVAIVTDQFRNGRPITGVAFNSIGRFAQSGILRERLIPRLLAADPDDLMLNDGSGLDPAAVAAVAMTNEKPGGHGDRAGAVAALELAAWDLNAKLADEPAYATIARSQGLTALESAAPVYAAGGYYYGTDSLTRLRDELLAYADQGYRAFKIKIGGAPLAADLARVETAIAVAGSPTAVAVDANGRFDLAGATEYGKVLAPLELRWFEEPADPLDYALMGQLAESYAGALATGENLFSSIDALNLTRFGGLRAQQDILQMDPGLSYGLTEYLKTLDIVTHAGFTRSQCIPHGGHLLNLHIVIALGLGGCEAYPDVFQPFGGFSPACRIEDGCVFPSDAPGFGLEQKPELAPHIKTLLEH